MNTPNPAALATQIQSRKPPPVEKWNPPLSGEMDLRILRNGVWIHEGTPICREALVRLFATILRRDEDGEYYLITPVEKWRIQVDDAPFLAVSLTITGDGHDREIRMRTNVGDEVTVSPEHPLRVQYAANGEPSPYVHIRARLWALISRPLFLELVELGEERNVDGNRLYGVWSHNHFFSLGSLEE